MDVGKAVACNMGVIMAYTKGFIRMTIMNHDEYPNCLDAKHLVSLEQSTYDKIVHMEPELNTNRIFNESYHSCFQIVCCELILLSKEKEENK